MTDISSQERPLPPIAWVASYPKSGNTWLRTLLYSYFFGAPTRMNSVGMRTHAIDRLMGDRGREFLASDDPALDAELRERLAQAQLETNPEWPDFAPEVAIVKSHYRFSTNHPLISEPGTAILAVRHPKDVMLSSFNYLEMLGRNRERDATAYVEQFIDRVGEHRYTMKGYGSWSGHWRSWIQQGRAHLPVVLVSYEQLLADPVFAFSQILDSIGVDPSPQRVRFAVQSASFDNMRTLEERQRTEEPEATNGTAATPSEGRSGDDTRFFFNKGRRGATIAETLGVDLDDKFDEAFAPEIDAFHDIAGRGLCRVVGVPYLTAGEQSTSLAA